MILASAWRTRLTWTLASLWQPLFLELSGLYITSERLDLLINFLTCKYTYMYVNIACKCVLICVKNKRPRDLAILLGHAPDNLGTSQAYA